MPTRGNVKAGERLTADLFSATRPLQNGRDEEQLALDLTRFINGLPVVAIGRRIGRDGRGWPRRGADGNSGRSDPLRGGP